MNCTTKIPGQYIQCPLGFGLISCRSAKPYRDHRDMGICSDYILSDTLTLFLSRGKIIPTNRKISCLYKTKALYEGRLKLILQQHISNDYLL